MVSRSLFTLFYNSIILTILGSSQEPFIMNSLILLSHNLKNEDHLKNQDDLKVKTSKKRTQYYSFVSTEFEIPVYFTMLTIDPSQVVELILEVLSGNYIL